MPMLSALDLLETRGLPRRITLLSTIEAETLDHFEQNNESFQDMDAREALSRRHARSWSSKLRQSTANNPRAWAIAISTMGELRRMAPYLADTRLPIQPPGQATIPKVPTLSSLDLLESRGLPRHISLLSMIEAETLYDFNQNGDNTSQDMDTTGTLSALGTVRPHVRTWNGAGSKLRRHALRTCTSKLLGE